MCVAVVLSRVNTKVDIWLRVCHVHVTGYRMKENRKMISIRLPPDLLKVLDAYRSEHEAEHGFMPQRTAVIIAAVRRYLADERAKPIAKKK